MNNTIKINQITVKIEKSKRKGFSYEYVFIGRRKYREYLLQRYFRILGFLGREVVKNDRKKIIGQ